MNQNRLLSKVTLVAIGAQIVSLLVILGFIDTGKGDAINAVIVAVCEALTLFGVLNNPTDKEGFRKEDIRGAVNLECYTFPSLAL